MKLPHFNHVGKHFVVCSSESVDSVIVRRFEPIPSIFCPHGREHTAQLLIYGSQRRIIDGGGAFGKYCRHHYVGSAGDGGFVKERVASVEAVGFYLIGFNITSIFKGGAESLYADEVGVEASSAYLVTAGL